MHARLADRPRLLFVDDEQRVLNSMRAMFRRDYELFLTTRGDEALRIIAEQPIDVVIADQRMPVMTGVELLTEVRQRSPHTVRILLTGYSDPDAIDSARRDGEVFRFLNKPCPAEELRTIVAEAVQIAREQAARPGMIVVDGSSSEGTTHSFVDDDADGAFQPYPAEGAERVDTGAAQAAADLVDDDDVDGEAETGEYPVLEAQPASDEAAPVHEASAAATEDAEDIYEVDDFADTTTMEIVMSGDMITVHEPGDATPLSYRAPAPIAPGMILQDPEPEPEPEAEPEPEKHDRAAAPETARDVAEPIPVVEPLPAPEPVVSRTEPPAPAPHASAPAVPVPPPPRAVPLSIATIRRSPALLISGAAFVIATCAVIVLLATREPATPITAADTAPPATTPPAGDPAATSPTEPAPTGAEASSQLADKLEFGALALDAGALVAPPGANALAFYLDARAEAPDDPAVVRGLDKLAQRLDERGREQLEQRNLTGLATTLAALAAIDPAEPRLTALRSEYAIAIDADFAQAEQAIAAGQWEMAMQFTDELARLPGIAEMQVAALREAIDNGMAEAAAREEARAARLAAEQAAAAAAAEQTQVSSAPADAEAVATLPEVAPPDFDELFANATASLRAGRLVAPAGDNARDYLEQASVVEPDNPGLAAGLQQLADALVARAFDSARNDDWAGVDTALDEAAALGVATDLVASTRNRIAAERIARESSRVLPLSQMQRREFVPPQYPVRALREKEEGWVVLTFTVQPDGTVTDVTPEDTSGRYGRQFASAARTAVSRWEFEPRTFLGNPIPQRVRARVNFQLEE